MTKSKRAQGVDKATQSRGESRERVARAMLEKGYVTMAQAADIMGIAYITMKLKHSSGKIPAEAVFKHPRTLGIFILKTWVDSQTDAPTL